ncbi:MAG: cobyrinate a,c-diamide synthase [Lachnospiraceae bacterium]
MKKLVIAAPKSGSGKTILTCGLLELLKRRQIPTASFKCGPDYIDPLFHKRVLGVESRNLDSFFETQEGLREVFIRGCLGKETGIALIEGVMGYFDGLAGILPKASTYEVANTLQAPVILAVDARGSSLSLVALIKGFLDYVPFDRQDEKEKKSRIKGVVLNQVSPMIYPGLKKAIEEELGITVAGYIPRLDFLHIESRHLGLVLPDEIADLKEQIGKLADVLETSLDVFALLEIAEGEKEKEPEKETFGTVRQMTGPKELTPFHLAVAKDEAFCFYYHENLKALEEQGAILTYFSPLHDERIPKDADGLLIGGGYPELYAEKLAENETMRVSIYQAAASGMPIHGECGGYLYLLETLEGADGKTYPMCGIFSGVGKKGERLGNFGYITLKARRDSAFLKENARIRAHEFHYWQVEKTEQEQENTLMDAKKPVGIREWKTMEEKGYTLAGFPHFYYRSCPEFVAGFAAACREYQVTVQPCEDSDRKKR